MTNIIITILFTLIFLVASFFFLKNRYNLGSREDTPIVLKNYGWYIIITVILFLIIINIQAWHILQSSVFNLLHLIKWSTLYWGLYLLAIIDFNERKIPNKLILYLLLCRLLILICEIATNLNYWTASIVDCFLGALLGGLIIFLCMFLSNNGLGMGDVKMFIMIGTYVGSSQILETIFLAFLVSALGGLTLLVTKKVSSKDYIPMAPFTCLGVLIEYILFILIC